MCSQLSENRGGRDKEGEAEEVRCMCGGGERRRAGKGNEERLAMEEDEMGVGDSKSWPSYPGGYGDETKDGGTHPSAEQGSGPRVGTYWLCSPIGSKK